MPYVTRSSEGRIIGLYGSIQEPMFTESRAWISSGKPEDRMGEYPHFIAEAQRLGMSLQDAHDDLARRWPEWVDEADLESPAESGVFDSGPALEEIREAYEDSHADNEGAGDVGIAEHTGADPGGDGGEPVEAGSDADPGEPADFSAEPVGDDLEPAEPNSYPGMMMVGDALATAKAMALMAVDDERFARVGDYDKAANQSKLDELRQIQQAIREGVHPPFTDEQAAELQALETFLPFTQRIDDHAQALRNAIREAADLEQLTAIDLLNGWPD